MVRGDGCPGGDPKRFQDSSNHVFYIVGECFSGGEGTPLAKDLTDKENNDYFLKPFFAFRKFRGI